jgi:serine/threonine protein kinase
VAAKPGAKRDSTGERIAGKYELGRLLGTGAMGAVYEGVHLELGKRLAIKLIRPEFSDSPEIVGRFRREARVASVIESEHVAQIFDFGRDATLGLYMVIEYLDGEDLEARLARERWVDPVQASAIAWQVARGLCRAHAAGVVHRDLKPANIFLTRRDDGSLLAKVLDFGISKFDEGRWVRTPSIAPGAAAPESLTERGTTLGTPQYMSPEQCQGKAELDGRTDVWALCAVLYEMLAGEALFSSTAGFVQVMQQIVSQDAVPLGRRAPWIPEALARVVDAGLVRKRDARTHDAATLADEILRACPQAGARALASEGARPGRLGSPVAARTTSATAPTDAPPPPSGDDGVEVFVRAGGGPVRVARTRR